MLRPMRSRGWQQRISVACGEDNQTHLVENYAEAPLKAFGPYADPKGLKMRLVQIGEGILQDDHYANIFNVGKNATLIVETDSYAKIYKAPKTFASQQMTFFVDAGGSLYFLPNPVIPFAGSNFRQQIKIELGDGAKAVFWDILSPGRIGYGECFQYKRYLNETKIILKDLGDHHPLVWDRQCFEPGKMDLKQPPFFSDFTHIGNLWIVGSGEIVKNFPSAQWIKSVRATLQVRDVLPDPYQMPFKDIDEDLYVTLSQKRNFYGGISRLTCGVLVRILGKTAEDIMNFFEVCVENLHEA